MGTKLIVDGIWTTLQGLVKKRPTQCLIAVAYFGTRAAKKLPLKAGSTLVVNMSDNAVKAGLTDPSEILKLVKKGVVVHSIRNLHAKVFVIGDVALIGSSNASENSANQLIEACVQTSIPSVIAESMRFVRSLEGDLVTPEYAKKKMAIYRRPRGLGAKSVRHKRGGKVVPVRSPLWVVPLVEKDLDEEYFSQRKRGIRKAKKRLHSSRRCFVDDFEWSRGNFIDRIGVDDLVIQRTKIRDKRVLVTLAERVLNIRRYGHGRQKRAIIYLKSLKKKKRQSLKRIIKRLGPQSTVLKRLTGPKLITDPHSKLWKLFPSATNDA